MKYRSAILGVTLLASFTANAKYANHHTKLEQHYFATTQAVTICDYRSKVSVGPRHRSFSIIHEGHTSCDQHYNGAELSFIKHTYR